MERTVKFELPADEAKQIQAEMRAQITEIQRINERIRKNQESTARLREETQTILAELAEIKIAERTF